MSQYLCTWFGTELVLISLFILAFVGVSSSLLANIPVVAIMLLMVKGYLVTAQLAPEMAMAGTFVDWPANLLPVFVAMMFAGTLGGERHAHWRFGQRGGRGYMRTPRGSRYLS